MKEIILEAAVENIGQATAFVDEELEALACPVKTQMQLDVAIDEVFSNIALYAFQEKKGKVALQFQFDEDARRVNLTFVDEGIPFNPLEKDDPDVTLSADERGVGGLGIFLVKKTMDDVRYRYEDGKNILTLQKRI